MEAQREIALEGPSQFLAEFRPGIQAGHFPFVLVGHQLEQAPRHGPGQRIAQPQGGLGLSHLLDQRGVPGCVGGILVVGEECAALGEHLGECGRLARIEADHLGC